MSYHPQCLSPGLQMASVLQLLRRVQWARGLERGGLARISRHGRLEVAFPLPHFSACSILAVATWQRFPVSPCSTLFTVNVVRGAGLS